MLKKKCLFNDKRVLKEHFKILEFKYCTFNAVKLIARHVHRQKYNLSNWKSSHDPWQWIRWFISIPCPGYIQASRALMITSVVLGTFGLLGALLGVQCSKAGGENYVLKGRIAGTAGVLFILQGNNRQIKCRKCILGVDKSVKLSQNGAEKLKVEIYLLLACILYNDCVIYYPINN